MKLDLPRLLEPCIALAKSAGQAILDIYQQPDRVRVEIKADQSPVTQADLLAHEMIIRGLRTLTPEIPVLSEEAAQIPYTTRKTWSQYWLVDPLDGTKEFIHRTHEFTVNIALIVEGQSRLGVIYAPCTDLTYYAAACYGAYKQVREHPAQSIHTRKKPEDECIVAVSRRHSVRRAAALMEKIPNPKKIMKGSSLKACIVAEGSADIYPSLGPTSEWDMGAAQCIIEEAGGAMLDLKFRPLRFNQKASLINPPLLIIGDPQFAWRRYLTDIEI